MSKRGKIRFLFCISIVVAVIVKCFSCVDIPNLNDSDNMQLILAPSESPIRLKAFSNEYEEITLRVKLKSGDIVKMAIEDYLIGVVAAEMPVAFELEALKAQAVAARTFTLRQISALGGTPCSAENDICTNSSCCQAWNSHETLQNNWGTKYESNLERIKAAVLSTEGIVMTFNGELIEALYHSASGGYTEYSQNVFAQEKPYLVSVKSPDDDDYIKTYTFKETEFLSLLNEAFKSANMRSFKTDFAILSRYESGRVESVRVGDVTVSGREIRQVLGLSSTSFSYCYEDDTIIITSHGFGHGVGMSQYGADALASDGYTYEDILLHYYQGVTLYQMEKSISTNQAFVP